MAVIEYFYSAHSSYTYVGSAEFMRIVRAAGRAIDHRPIDFTQVVAMTGPGRLNRTTPARRAYYSHRQVERWAEFRNVPIMKENPIHHDEDMSLVHGMLIAGIGQGVNVDQLAHVMLEAHWVEGADLTDRQTLSRLGAKAGFEAEPLLAAALDPEIQAIYAANNEEAIRRSVFGSPTFFIDGDMFYGQDQLDLVERALKKRFAGTWPNDYGSRD